MDRASACPYDLVLLDVDLPGFSGEEVLRRLRQRPPTSVGMTMVEGPWFFASFGGGWRFTPEGDGCRAVWKYTYAIRPRWLRWVAEPIGQWLLGREIRRRIAAFGKACTDPVVLAAVPD